MPGYFNSLIYVIHSYVLLNIISYILPEIFACEEFDNLLNPKISSYDIIIMNPQ